MPRTHRRRGAEVHLGRERGQRLVQRSRNGLDYFQFARAAQMVIPHQLPGGRRKPG